MRTLEVGASPPGFGPALAVPGVEGLPDPVRGTLGPHLHHERGGQAPTQCGVEAAGEAEVAADADRVARAAGAGQLSRRPGIAGQRPRDADRSAGAGLGQEGHPRRHDRGGKDHEDRRGRGGHGRQRCHQSDNGDPSTAARRRPHLGQAPESEAGPGHDVETEGKVDGLGPRHRHQPGRRGKREEQVAPGRHMERVDDEDRDQKEAQRTVDGVMTSADVREWKNHAKAPMAPAATTTFTQPGGRARVRCEKTVPAETRDHGDTRGETCHLAYGRTRRNRRQDRPQAGDPQADRILRGPG